MFLEHLSLTSLKMWKKNWEKGGQSESYKTEWPITSGLGDVAIFRVTLARTDADQRYEDENIFYSLALFVRLICRWAMLYRWVFIRKAAMTPNPLLDTVTFPSSRWPQLRWSFYRLFNDMKSFKLNALRGLLSNRSYKAWSHILSLNQWSNFGGIGNVQWRNDLRIVIVSNVQGLAMWRYSVLR